jgi:hypothetical protein
MDKRAVMPMTGVKLTGYGVMGGKAVDEVFEAKVKHV